MKFFLGFFHNLNIRYKLFAGYLLLIIISITLGNYIIYSQVKKIVENNIESELKKSTSAILTMVQTTAAASIRNRLRAAAEKNREIIQDIYSQFKEGLITEKTAKNNARRILFSQIIGKTGYIYCVNSKGIAVVHPNPAVKDKNFLYRNFIKEQINRKEGYLEYEWENPGESQKKFKALYMTYFEPWDWIISVSSYQEEFKHLIDASDFRNSILSMRFGKTGYSFVLDSKGKLIIHPKLDKILKEKFYNNNEFIQKLCSMKTGKLTYSWKNPEEKGYRQKLVIFNYIPEYDWIIASAGYLDEIYSPLKIIKNNMLIIMGVMLLIILPISMFISASVIRPVRELASRLSKAANGDLSVRMSWLQNDEIGQLNRYFNEFMEKIERYNNNIRAEIKERERTENALRESEKKYKTILEQMQEGYYEIDIDGNFIFFNSSMLRILGYSKNELSGMNKEKITDQDNSTELVRIFDKVIKLGRSATIFNWKVIKKNAQQCLLETSISLIKDKNGTPLRFSGICRDITARKKADDALRISEEMFSKAFRSSPSGIFIATMKNGRMINVNDSFLKMTGYSLFELINESLFSINFFSNRPAGIKLLTALRQKDRIINREVEFYTKSGKLRIGIISAEVIELWDENCLIATVEDLTKTKRLEREILNISEREREKIGRDLHDDLCPHLIGIEALIKVLKNQLENSALNNADLSDKIGVLIKEAIQKTRRLLMGLQPVEPVDSGFETSLISLAENVKEIYGIECCLICNSTIDFVNKTKATHIYYIAHEAIHNAVKHGNSQNISISLLQYSDILTLEIRDDGIGLPEKMNQNGMGLQIMKYRAGCIGADLEIKNNRDSGVSVLLNLPWKNNKKEV